MSQKSLASIGLVVVGIAVGSLVTAALQKNNDSVTPGSSVVVSKPEDRGRSEEMDARLADHERKIAQLTDENETLRQQVSGVPPSRAMQSSLTPAERSARITAMLEQSENAKKKRATDMLLAAGYSSDTIEWLRNRSDELQKQRRQAETERRARGLPIDPVKEMAYQYDKDIELRYEIGDDEYEKYLQALGRPSKVNVVEVLPGSIADSVGIKAGDVIVDYGGKRLFNLGELNGLAMGKVGESVTVTVNRGGQELKIVAPGGIFGVRSRNPLIDNLVAVSP